MSLDVTVLDDEDQVVRSVGFGVDEHWEVVEFARQRNLPLLGRLRDYYSDAQISVEELAAFLEEVEAAIRSGELNPEVRPRLEQLADVIRFAMSEDRSLVVLAD